MGLRRFRKKLRHKVKRATKASFAPFRAVYRPVRDVQKKSLRFIKDNPELVGAAVGTAFGAPMIGSTAGSFFGQARTAYKSGDYSSFLPSPDNQYSMPDEVAQETPEPAAAEGFAPAIDKKWLVIGGIALLAVILLMNKKS